MKRGSTISYLIIGAIFVLALSGPIIIVKLTYSPNMFIGFPGEASAWFGFWASYSGTLATLLVALITWMNSRKMEELQRRYYELDTDVNLRLSKVAIVPQILERGELKRYKMTLVFDNMAKNLIHEIRIKENRNLDDENQKFKGQIAVTIGETTERLDILMPEFFIHDGKPVFQFCISIDESPMKEMFAGFYYYFSQFSLDIPKMKLELRIDIKYGESDKDKAARFLEVDLLPTPKIEHRRKYLEFSEVEYAAGSYEILIENYKLKRV